MYSSISNYETCLCDTATYGDHTGLTALYLESGLRPEEEQTYSSDYGPTVKVRATKIA